MVQIEFKEIDIKVEEKPTGEISLGAGVGTSGGSTMFGVKENNFLGKGILLDTNLQFEETELKVNFFILNLILIIQIVI